jgi:hypothetical protein
MHHLAASRFDAFRTGFSFLTASLLLACGDERAPQPTGASGAVQPPSPIASAYAALTAGQTDQAVAAIQALDGLLAREPDNGRAALYSGAMRLWVLAEQRASLDTAQALETSTTAVTRFQSARALLPDDDRAPGFLGLTRVDLGHALGDAAMVAQGMSDLADGIARFPAYTHFLRALVNDSAGPGSPDLASAVADALAVMDSCQAVPDASGQYPYPQGPLDSVRRVCNDQGIVPHVWEGFFIAIGDIVLKAGWPADKARAIYRSAQNSPTFDRWPFAADLQQRIADADARAVLYADGDPTNDPPLWSTEGHLCVGCHQAQGAVVDVDADVGDIAAPVAPGSDSDACAPGPFPRMPCTSSVVPGAAACVPACLTGAFGSVLQPDGCAGGELCAPCTNPTSGRPTGACDDPSAGDGGGAGGGTDAAGEPG